MITPCNVPENFETPPLLGMIKSYFDYREIMSYLGTNPYICIDGTKFPLGSMTVTYLGEYSMTPEKSNPQIMSMLDIDMMRERVEEMRLKNEKMRLENEMKREKLKLVRDGKIIPAGFH